MAKLKLKALLWRHSKCQLAQEKQGHCKSTKKRQLSSGSNFFITNHWNTMIANESFAMTAKEAINPAIIH